MLISDEMIESAFSWLQDNAGPAAAAKAERVRAEYNVKRVKARLFLESLESSVVARESDAICQAAYDEAVEREAQAVEMDEFHRNQRNKAEAICEAWRSQSANYRALGKIG